MSEANSPPISAEELAAQKEIEQCQAELEQLAIQTGLDVAGVLDPSPVSDIASAGYSIKRGDYSGAALSLLGVIPYLGDLGKAFKAPRITARVAQLKKRLEAAMASLKIANTRRVLTQTRHLQNTYQLAGNDPARVAKDMYRMLPLWKNPRLLAKHPGPVSPQQLVDELMRKGFVQVKQGNHQMQGVLENSDVFVRKVVRGGRPEFECVRIDIRKPNSHLDRRVGKNGKVEQRSASELQYKDKAKRQLHIGLQDQRLGTQREMVDQLQTGRAFKGDFTHFHRESFPATESNLKQYLTPPRKDPKSGEMIFEKVEGLKEFDFSGTLVQ